MYYLGMIVFILCVFAVSFFIYRSRKKKLPIWGTGLIYAFMFCMPFVVFPAKKFVESNQYAAIILFVFMGLTVAAQFGGISLAHRLEQK